MALVSREIIAELEQKLGYDFRSIEWLKKALSHPSAKRQHTEFERLEFLGDRVLGLCVATLLLKKFPMENEGALAKRFSVLVSRQMCLFIAQKINLECYLDIIVDPHALSNVPAIMADAMEAVLAAVYLDSDLNTCLTVVERLWKNTFIMENDRIKNPKSELQEKLQKRKKNAPLYELVAQAGSAHEPVLVYKVVLANGLSFEGQGPNRKVAEQEAARRALEYLARS